MDSTVQGYFRKLDKGEGVNGTYEKSWGGGGQNKTRVAVYEGPHFLIKA